MKASLSVGDKMFLAAYNRMFARFLGWRQDEINAAYVRTFGISGLLKFGKMIGDVLQTLNGRYGEAVAQHLVGFAGLMNGCGYCGVGHNLAANVLLFQERGAIFPIDEQDVPRLQTMQDAAIMAELRERLAGTEFADELKLLERMYELRSGSVSDASPDDQFLLLALEMWLINNECTIEVGLDVAPQDVPLFAKFSKDGELYKRYRQARDASN